MFFGIGFIQTIPLALAIFATIKETTGRPSDLFVVWQNVDMARARASDEKKKVYKAANKTRILKYHTRWARSKEIIKYDYYNTY